MYYSIREKIREEEDDDDDEAIKIFVCVDGKFNKGLLRKESKRAKLRRMGHETANG